ncbi:hypothetical protein [Azospirillum doebereinerae]
MIKHPVPHSAAHRCPAETIAAVWVWLHPLREPANGGGDVGSTGDSRQQSAMRQMGLKSGCRIAGKLA